MIDRDDEIVKRIYEGNRKIRYYNKHYVTGLLKNRNKKILEYLDNLYEIDNDYIKNNEIKVKTCTPSLAGEIVEGGIGAILNSISNTCYNQTFDNVKKYALDEITCIEEVSIYLYKSYKSGLFPGLPELDYDKLQKEINKLYKYGQYQNNMQAVNFISKSVSAKDYPAYFNIDKERDEYVIYCLNNFRNRFNNIENSYVGYSIFGNKLNISGVTDIIIDNTLIDLKTSKTKFSRNDYRQQVLYYILSKDGKVAIDKDIVINSIALYNPLRDEYANIKLKIDNVVEVIDDIEYLLAEITYNEMDNKYNLLDAYDSFLKEYDNIISEYKKTKPNTISVIGDYEYIHMGTLIDYRDKL